MVIDAHAHIHDPAFNADRRDMMDRARHAGVESIITIGTTRETSRAAIAVARDTWPMSVRATVGLHPHVFSGGVGDEREEALGYADGSQETRASALRAAICDLEELIVNNRDYVCAIGEIGLDYHKHEDDLQRTAQEEAALRSWQAEGLSAQLDLAWRLRLPAVIHCRDAADDLITILSSLRMRGTLPPCVLHCYSGDPRVTQAFFDLGCFFSLAGNITYLKKMSPLLDGIRTIPSDRLMVETDCPYLAPVPHRGKRNEPAFVRDTLSALALLRGEESATLMRSTTSTARIFFSLPA